MWKDQLPPLNNESCFLNNDKFKVQLFLVSASVATRIWKYLKSITKSLLREIELVSRKQLRTIVTYRFYILLRIGVYSSNIRLDGEKCHYKEYIQAKSFWHDMHNAIADFDAVSIKWDLLFTMVILVWLEYLDWPSLTHYEKQQLLYTQ